MFKKLLSNLPFNPSLINQVSFYAQRLKRETAIRRLGVVFVVLAVLVQIIAIASPPQPSLASSNNDLINGGIGSSADAINACNANIGNYGDILGYYNISCSDLNNTSVVTLNSRDYGSQLFSMGRIAYGKAGETPVSIKGTNYWLRYLWSWDGSSSSSYTALRGTTQDGKTYFILFGCGNLVFVGLPAPTPRCPWNPLALLSTDPRCFEPCPVQGKETLPKTSTQCFNPCPVTGKSSIPANDPRCFEPCPYPGKQSIPKANTSLCYEACPYNGAIAKDSPSCKPCESSQTREDKTSCLELSKKAANSTQNISDANNTTAHPGDVITYTLSVKNNGKADIDSYQVQENISDVLDYATLINPSGAALDNSGIIKWPAEKIRAGQTLSKVFTVKVKDPIPSTPASSSDPGHFDLTMTNVYGNVITIKVPGSTIKTTEVIAASLPNTGPGATIAIGFGLTMIVGYFFARSRLMSKELAIIKADYASGEI